jgi:hypothetical protein
MNKFLLAFMAFATYGCSENFNLTPPKPSVKAVLECTKSPGFIRDWEYHKGPQYLGIYEDKEGIVDAISVTDTETMEHVDRRHEAYYGVEKIKFNGFILYRTDLRLAQGFKWGDCKISGKSLDAIRKELAAEKQLADEKQKALDESTRVNRKI